MPLLEVNGVRLLVEESGSGEPLVLVHGSWVDRQGWALVEQDLARSFRVVSYDRRGHTGSEDRPEPGTRRDDEDDLAALIEALDIAPANVAANSFGASIALSLAARRPELFRTLCAHEPPLFALVADDPAMAQFAEATRPVLEQIERGESETAARGFVEIVLGPGAWETMPAEEQASMSANADTFAGELADDGWAAIDLEALGRSTVPTLLTQGDQSPPFFSKIIAQLDQAMDGAELKTLPGAGHIPQITHPADYMALIRRFAAG
ncbi:MAG: alpha/beta fold hydrolase [Solirubrobacterales bacterium]